MAGVPERIVPFAPEDTDEQRKAKKARAKEAPKTLLIVAETMVGMTVDIELRNDTELHGTLVSVDREMNMELSAVRCLKPHARHPVQLQHMFLNGRYVRYIHIPEGVDIVRAVHNRTKKQGKAHLSHRRTSEVIRESVARRERMRVAQENAVRAATGVELIPTAGRRLGAAPDERSYASSALEYMDTSRSRLLQSLLEQRTGGGQQQATSDDTSNHSQTDRHRQAQDNANALGFIDKMMPSCRDCKLSFTWTAAEQAFYHEKGFEHEPQRCKGCLKDKKQREESRGSR